jgi:hypothetical protein
LLIIEQFLRQKPIFLWILDFINFNKLLLFFAFIYFDGNAVNFLLILLHLDNFINLLFFLVFTSFQIEVEITLRFLAHFCSWHHVKSLFDSLNVGFLVHFQLLWVNLPQFLFVSEHPHAHLDDLMFLLPVLLLCLSIRGDAMLNKVILVIATLH